MTMASTSSHPIAGTCAVIRIDPVATVQDLHDEEALTLAQRMTTGTYTIYVEQILETPSLDKPWYLCAVLPLTSCAEDGMHMVNSRERVHSVQRASFPRHAASLSDPYDQDAEFRTYVRVQADPELCDPGRPFTPATLDLVVPGRPWSVDGDSSLNSSYDYQHRLSGTHGSTQKGVRPSPSELARARMASLSSSSASWSTGDDAQSCSCCRPSEDDLADGGYASSHLAGNAACDEDVYLLPIVNFWPRSLGQLEEQDLWDSPDAAELIKERDAVANIVLDARSRFASIRADRRASIIPHEASRTGAIVSGIPRKRQKVIRLRPVVVLTGKFRANLRSLGSRIASIARPPYLLVWP
ncbi:hypothetical protein C8Q78DRAFT_184361 [Trametes maxima]|nr:hypothetical protein C8Q78DRAFT_184361 [Trametes maxima]